VVSSSAGGENYFVKNTSVNVYTLTTFTIDNVEYKLYTYTVAYPSNSLLTIKTSNL
jgi:hypothetical protein